MKRLIVTVLAASLAVPASAQVSVMVRTDRTDLATEKNVPDSLEKVRKRAAAKGGTWDTLLANDTTCGGGAVAIAYAMGDRRYFLVTGKKSATEANAEAMAKAKEFASARKGWITTAGPSWFNTNEYRQNVEGTEWVLQELGLLERCGQLIEDSTKRAPSKAGSIGVRN